MKKKTDTSKVTNDDIRALLKAFDNLRNWRIVRVYESRWMFFWYNIYRGMLTGLGTVLGATVLIAILIHFSKYLIDWPIIGELLQNLFGILQEYNNIKQGTTPLVTPIPTP